MIQTRARKAPAKSKKEEEREKVGEGRKKRCKRDRKDGEIETTTFAESDKKRHNLSFFFTRTYTPQPKNETVVNLRA